MTTTLADIHEQLVNCYQVPSNNREVSDRTWERWINGLLTELADLAADSGVTSDRLCARLGLACDRSMTFGRVLYDALDNEGWLHPTYYSWSFDEGVSLMPYAELVEALEFEASRRKEAG